MLCPQRETLDFKLFFLLRSKYIKAENFVMIQSSIIYHEIIRIITSKCNVKEANILQQSSRLTREIKLPDFIVPPVSN